MTDIAPDFDFTEASQAAEAAALEADGGGGEQPPVTIEAPSAPEPEPSTPERRRDPDTGQFLPNEQEPEFEAPQTEAEREFVLGRYRTLEDAERGIAEKDRYIQELQTREQQYRQFLAEQQAVQQQQQRTQVPTDWEEALEQNPVGAANYARQAGNPRLYNEALQAMDEYMPGASMMYETALQAQEQQRALEQQLAQRLAPFDEAVTQQQTTRELLEFDRQNPWFKTLPENELLATLTENPQLQARVARQDPDALFVLGAETLRRRGQTYGQIQGVARTQAEEAERARTDAFTASSSTATANDTAVTPEDAEAERTIQLWRANQSKWESAWDRPPELEARLTRLRGLGS